MKNGIFIFFRAYREVSMKRHKKKTVYSDSPFNYNCWFYLTYLIEISLLLKDVEYTSNSLVRTILIVLIYDIVSCILHWWPAKCEIKGGVTEISILLIWKSKIICYIFHEGKHFESSSPTWTRLQREYMRWPSNFFIFPHPSWKGILSLR